jgi:hypothetical protein
MTSKMKLPETKEDLYNTYPQKGFGRTMPRISSANLRLKTGFAGIYL